MRKMPLVIHLLLLFGRVLAYDEHMDQDTSFPSLEGKGLLSGEDPYPPFGRIYLQQESVKATNEEENTEKSIEVDVTKEYGVEQAKDYAVDVTKEYGVEITKDYVVDVTKGYVVEVSNEKDENIIDMEVAIMESEDAKGDIDGLRMEVFNEVVLEELLQKADRSSQHFPWKVLWLGLGLGSVILAVLLLSVLLGVYCRRRSRTKKHVISNM